MNEAAEAHSLTRRTVGAAAWSFSGFAVQAVLRIIVLVVLARLLTPAAFGVVAAALVIVYFSNNLAQIGIGPALVQRAELERRHITTGFTLSVLLGVLLAAAAWLAAPLIAAFFRMADLTGVLRLIVLAFPLQGLAIVPTSLLTRDLKFRLLAANDVVSYAVGYGGVGVVLALLGFGALALALAFVAQAAVSAVLLLSLARFPKRLHLDRRSAGELLRFGGGQTLATLVNYVALQADNIVAGRWLGAAALGLYSRAYNLMATGVSLFGGVLDVVIFPAMSKIQFERARLAQAYRRGLSAVTLLLFPVSAFLCFAAPELILVMLGPQWTGAIRAFQFLAWGVLLRSAYKVGGSVNRAVGAVYAHAWRHVWYAATVFAAAWVGTRWGVVGVAAGVTAALLANYLFVSSLSLRLTGVTWSEFVRAHVPGAIVAAVVGAVTGGTTIALRGLGAAPGVIVLSALVAAAAAAIVLLWMMPSRLLGADGTWIIQTVSSYLPAGMPVLARFRKREERAASSS